MKAFGRLAIVVGLFAAPSLVFAAPKVSVQDLSVTAAPSSSVSSSSADIVSPRDPASGMATGKRMHKPMVITAEWSSQSQASSDCTSQHGVLSVDGSKFTCTVDVDSDAAAMSVCAKPAGPNAMCKP
jgi:hypothetical protein